MKLREPEKSIVFITIVLALAIIVVSVTFRLNDWGGSELAQAEHTVSVLPDDFSLDFVYGPCIDDITTRTSVSLSATAEITVSRLTGVHTTTEQSSYLSEAEQGSLLSRLEDEDVWAVPAVLQTDDDINVWGGECSHFELEMEGRSTAIDEAFGVDPNYFRIKNEIKRLVGRI